MAFVTKGRYDLVYRDFVPACRSVMSKAVVRAGLIMKTKVEKLTPVDTGRARSNWHFSGDKPVLSVTSPSTPGKVNVGTPKTVVWYLTNNVHYMEWLEAGTAHRPPLALMSKISNAFPKAYSFALKFGLKEAGLAA